MRTLLLAALVVCSSALAAPVTFKRVNATHISNHVLWLPAGTHTFATANGTPGADTVIEVLGPTGASVAYNDDFGGTLLSQVTVSVPAAASYRVIVHAYSSASAGRADVLQNGAVLYANEQIGGTDLWVDPGTLTYQTALVNGGTPDTVLYGGDCSSGRIVVLDDDSGVGLQSEFSRTNICRLWLAAYSVDGVANVYVNDRGNDHDADGLGQSLEIALGTCDVSSQPGCDASKVFNLQDTDRDALPDGYEVLGKDDPSAPQYLPKWGADPRHKDVFVEIDTVPGQSTLILTAADAATAQSYYNPATADDVRNPDGLPGIRVHLDLQIASDPTAEFPTYGNWGGSNMANVANYSIAPDDAANFNPIRKGLFRYALYDNNQYGGQTAGAPGDRAGWGSSPGDASHGMFTFLHEILGHGVGLNHWGHDTWGATNCKPHYVSIMNYSYGGWYPFSRGERSDVIDSSGVSEANPFVGSGVSPAYLGPYSNYNLNTSGPAVDWNRDNVFEPSPRAIRADVAWAPWVGCGALMMNRQTVVDFSTEPALPDSQPRMIRLGSYLYAFFLKSDGTVWYSRGQVSGQDINGSCPINGWVSMAGGMAPCMTWLPAEKARLLGKATGFSVLQFGSGAVLAYREASLGQLRVLQGGADSTGKLGFGADQALGTTDAAPEVADMYVSSSYGSNELIGVIYSTGGYYRWLSIAGIGGGITPRGDLLTTTGAKIPAGKVGPSATNFPNRGGRSYAATIGRTCAVLPNTTSQLKLYCLDKASDRWEDLTDTLGCMNPIDTCFGSGPARICTTVCNSNLHGRATLQFHTVRDGSGFPIGGDDSRGQFWLGYTYRDSKGQDWPRVRRSQQLSSTTGPGAGMTWPTTGMVGDDWTVVVRDSNYALYEDNGMSALKAVWLQDYGNCRGCAAVRHLDFFPFFDGTGRQVLKDGNDFRVMERGICRGLRDDTWCGSSSTNPWGY